jgi:hypothetical protein
MPPRQLSRHVFSRAYEDNEGDLVLTEPEPFKYKPYRDNIHHTVQTGETLFTIAAKYFKGFDRPNGLWWIIADFQPIPIHDPTVSIAENTTIVIPSQRTVIEEIFSNKRYDEQ